MLRESIGDNNPDDQQIFSDDELNFMLDAALAQVNQVRPRSVRETIDLNADEDTYVLSDVQTVTRIDWLRDNKFIRELPPKAWEVWGTNEFDEFEYGQDNVLVFITEPFRAFGSGDYQARVHGYAPWVWDESGDSCELAMFDSSSPAVDELELYADGPAVELVGHEFITDYIRSGLFGDAGYHVQTRTVDTSEHPYVRLSFYAARGHLGEYDEPENNDDVSTMYVIGDADQYTFAFPTLTDDFVQHSFVMSVVNYDEVDITFGSNSAAYALANIRVELLCSYDGPLKEADEVES